MKVQDPLTFTRAKAALMQYMRQEPTKLYTAGKISLWLLGGFNVLRVEELLERMVVEGILRHATTEELRTMDRRDMIGYYLTDLGFASLPPEDRSYGVL